MAPASGSVNATPSTHSSDTKANHPAARVHDEIRFFRNRGPISLLHRYGAVTREPWAFALVGALMCAEWILRRAWGLR